MLDTPKAVPAPDVVTLVPNKLTPSELQQKAEATRLVNLLAKQKLGKSLSKTELNHVARLQKKLRGA